MAKEKQKSVKITLKKSVIGYNKKQKLTVRTLGLRKLHQTVEHVYTPQIKGMVNKVSHLVEVEEI